MNRIQNILRLVLIGNLIFAFGSCKGSKTIIEKQEVIHSYIKDSVRVTESMIMDTILISEVATQDSVSLEILKQIGKFKHSNGKATSTIIYKDGVLTSDCNCDEEVIPYIKELNQSFQALLNESFETHSNNSEVTEKNNNPWIEVLVLLGTILNSVILILRWKSN